MFCQRLTSRMCWTWFTDTLYLLWLKSEWQRHEPVLSGCVRPLTLHSSERGKWMHNQGCYLAVIQVLFPRRIKKFTMTVPVYSVFTDVNMEYLFNIAESSCYKYKFDLLPLRVHVYMFAWDIYRSHSYPICLCIRDYIVLFFFSPTYFFFLFFMGNLFMLASLLDVDGSRHKTFRSLFEQVTKAAVLRF